MINLKKKQSRKFFVCGVLWQTSKIPWKENTLWCKYFSSGVFYHHLIFYMLSPQCFAHYITNFFSTAARKLLKMRTWWKSTELLGLISFEFGDYTHMKKCNNVYGKWSEIQGVITLIFQITGDINIFYFIYWIYLDLYKFFLMPIGSCTALVVKFMQKTSIRLRHHPKHPT